jgi:hypothetical protein
MHHNLGMDKSKLTEAGYKKVLKEFYPMVIEGKKYCALDKMYVEEQMK